MMKLSIIYICFMIDIQWYIFVMIVFYMTTNKQFWEIFVRVFTNFHR